MSFLLECGSTLPWALRANGCRFAAFACRPDAQLLTVAIADAARYRHHTFPRSTPQSFLPPELRKSVHKTKTPRLLGASIDSAVLKTDH